MTNPIKEMIAFIEKYPTLHGADYLNYARSLEKEERKEITLDEGVLRERIMHDGTRMFVMSKEHHNGSHKYGYIIFKEKE